MTHSTTGVSRVKNPAKGLSEVVGIIDYPRDTNQLNNLLFSPVLDLEIRSFNMLGTISRMTGIDNIDAGFVVFDAQKSYKVFPRGSCYILNTCTLYRWPNIREST